MADRPIGIALQILGVLAETPFPGLTRGEIRTALRLPSDTEITARVRELRDYVSYGEFDVRVERSTGREYRYHLLYRERLRAQRFLARKVAAA